MQKQNKTTFNNKQINAHIQETRRQIKSNYRRWWTWFQFSGFDAEFSAPVQGQAICTSTQTLKECSAEKWKIAERAERKNRGDEKENIRRVGSREKQTCYVSREMWYKIEIQGNVIRIPLSRRRARCRYTFSAGDKFTWQHHDEMLVLRFTASYTTKRRIRGHCTTERDIRNQSRLTPNSWSWWCEGGSDF